MEHITVILYGGFEVFTAVVMKSIIFWDVAPCSPLSSTLRSSETSGATQRTTLRHIPEDDTLHVIWRFSFAERIPVSSTITDTV
jgi:hypothetical protein